MFCHKVVIYSSFPLLTLLCIFSPANAFHSSVTLSKRIFQEPKDTVVVQLIRGRNTTLFDALVDASSVNDGFKFTGINYSFGVYIDSIGGLAENKNKSLYWFLYKKTSLGEEPLQTGVSSTIVADNEHYLFWYKKSSHSKNNSVTDDINHDTDGTKVIDPPLYKRIWSVVQSVYDYIKSKF